MALSNVFVLQVSCGHSHCAVVTETGDVWAWGAFRAHGHTEPNVAPNLPTLLKVLSGKAIVQVSCAIQHSMALSDYRRLSGKAALAAVRSMGGAAAVKDKPPVPAAVGGRRDSEDQSLDPKKPEVSMGGYPGEENAALLSGLGDRLDFQEGVAFGLAVPTMEREAAFLSAELKAYQEQTLKLAKALQEAKTKLEALQNENSFLKSELEVMHQCSNDADERLDTLRRHFSERIREMERRYAEKERVWKETFGRLRSHLELGAMDVDPSAMGLSPEFAMGRRTGAPGHSGGRSSNAASVASLGVDTASVEVLSGGALGESGAGLGLVGDGEVTSHPGAEGTIAAVRADTPGASERSRAVGSVSLWPGGPF
jgi:hypothetical protein